jgi:hypothetical protein
MSDMSNRIWKDLSKIEASIKQYGFRSFNMSEAELREKFPQYCGVRQIKLDYDEVKKFLDHAGGGIVSKRFCTEKRLQAVITVYFESPAVVKAIVIVSTVSGYGEIISFGDDYKLSLAFAHSGRMLLSKIMLEAWWKNILQLPPVHKGDIKPAEMDLVAWRRVIGWLRCYIQAELAGKFSKERLS